MSDQASLSDMDPFIVMAAPNGARRQKTDHPLIPLSASELAECAEDIAAAGASLMHLHVRNDDGSHTLDAGRYKRAISAIKDRVGNALILQITTEAVGIYTRLEQMDVVKTLRPEAASLALRELCPDDLNILEFKSFWGWMTEEGIFPQLILYNMHDFKRFCSFFEGGVFGDTLPFILIVLGHYSSSEDSHGEAVSQQYLQNRIEDFTTYFKSNGIPWSVCCFGLQEYAATTISARLGGHIRVGFENNIWSKDGKRACSNADLVKSACLAAKKQGRVVAAPNQVKSLFKLS